MAGDTNAAVKKRIGGLYEAWFNAGALDSAAGSEKRMSAQKKEIAVWVVCVNKQRERVAVKDHGSQTSGCVAAAKQRVILA